MLDSFIEFYGKHSISPVRQNISDLPRHFERRNNLFRQLGVLSPHLSGKRILEVGPGSGHNAIHIASLKPSVYDLVEGNPQGVVQTKSLFISTFGSTDSICIHETLIEDFKSDQKYDLVICEGMLSGSKFPDALLQKISSFVDTSGILVITTTDLYP